VAAAGKILVLIGAVLLLLGVLLLAGGRIPFLGRLPGDIRLEGERHTFYFPIITCIVLSIVFTVLLNVAARLFLHR